MSEQERIEELMQKEVSVTLRVSDWVAIATITNTAALANMRPKEKLLPDFALMAKQNALSFEHLNKTALAAISRIDDTIGSAMLDSATREVEGLIRGYIKQETEKEDS